MRTVAITVLASVVLVAAGCGSSTTSTTSRTTSAAGAVDDPATTAGDTLPPPRLTVGKVGFTVFGDGELGWGAYVRNGTDVEARDTTAVLTLTDDATKRVIQRTTVTLGEIPAQNPDGVPVSGLLKVPEDTDADTQTLTMTVTAGTGVPAEDTDVKAEFVRTAASDRRGGDEYPHFGLKNTGTVTIKSPSTVFVIYKDKDGYAIGGDRGELVGPVAPGDTGEIELDGRFPDNATDVRWRLMEPQG